MESCVKDWRKLLVILAFAVLAVGAAHDLLRLGDALPWRVMMNDFVDFYCAGQAIGEKQNPYTYEPMHACEHRLVETDAFRLNPSYAIPAPQPPYDFPPFVLLAKMEYAQARLVGAIAIVAAVLLAALGLTRLRVPFDVALLALALPAGYVQINAGQIVPFELLFVILTGVALSARRDVLAGVCAALTTIEPNVGLFVCAAVFLFVPRARWTLAIAAPVLASVGLMVVGPGVFLQYFAHVLPAQAAAEVEFPFQYSLTWAVHYLGVPAGIAQALGTASLVAMLLFALRAAPRVARALDRRELLVFLPAACAVIAGSYVHAAELCFAIPAALVFATTLTGGLKTVSAAALCALTIPWLLVWGIKKLFLASLLVCAVLLVRLQIQPLVTIGLLTGFAGTMYAFELFPPHLTSPLQIVQRMYSASDLIQVELQNYTEQLQTHDFGWFAIKLPSWAALAGLLAVAFRVIRERASAGSINR
jgi:hypothetical protein